MDKERIIEGLKSAGITVGTVLKDAVYFALNDLINKEIEYAQIEQRNEVIELVVRMLDDMKVSKEEKIRLLSDYFGVDSRTEAIKYLECGKK